MRWFFEKPFNSEDFIAKLSELIQRRPPGPPLPILEKLAGSLHSAGVTAIFCESESRRQLFSTLVDCLTSPLIPVPVLVACGRLLSCLLLQSSCDPARAERALGQAKTLAATPHVFGRIDYRVLDLIEWMESADVTQPLSLERFAPSCRAAKDLGKKLREQTTLSFVDWHRALRLRRCLSPLIDGRLSVGQIGHAKGYQHESQFSREFKETFGLPPKLFQQCLIAESRLR